MTILYVVQVMNHEDAWENFDETSSRQVAEEIFERCCNENPRAIWRLIERTTTRRELKRKGPAQ